MTAPDVTLFILGTANLLLTSGIVLTQRRITFQTWLPYGEADGYCSLLLLRDVPYLVNMMLPNFIIATFLGIKGVFRHPCVHPSTTPFSRKFSLVFPSGPPLA